MTRGLIPTSFAFMKYLLHEVVSVTNFQLHADAPRSCSGTVTLTVALPTGRKCAQRANMLATAWDGKMPKRSSNPLHLATIFLRHLAQPTPFFALE
jgi:hypothetical protein